MRVWYPDGDADLQIEGIEMVVGEARPEGYEVLVEGGPKPMMIEDQPKLRAVVVPWAGVSESTLAVVRSHPPLTLHNLHHNAADTAETALALLFAAARSVVPYDQGLRRGDWSPRYSPSTSVTLAGRSALVLGYGAIGRHIGRALVGMGMTVAATRRSLSEPMNDGEIRVHPADRLGALLPGAQVLVVALPGTAETKALIGADEIAQLPAGAILVNIARGPIVEEAALYAALEEGRLHSAGLDVWYRYPRDGEEGSTLPSTLPFHELANVAMSPHRGGASADGETRRRRELGELLRALARGETPNRVDLDLGY